MTGDPRVGAMFTTKQPVERLLGAARRVEELGFDEFWVVEDCFDYGGLTSAAMALSVTERVAVGIGLLPAAVRITAIAAMEVATIATVYPHRLQVAVGHGVDAWMRQIGARPPDRVKALEEVVGAVRGLLHGESVTVRGDHVTLDNVTLSQPPAVAPPILVGTTGERGIDLAGRVADGVLLPEGTGESAIRSTAAMLPANAQITVYAWLRIDHDEGAADAVVGPVLGAWRERELFPRLYELGGVTREGQIGHAEIDRLTVAGTPESCARAVSRLHQAGAASVVLVPIGDDQADQLELFASEVLPRLPSS